MVFNNFITIHSEAGLLLILPDFTENERGKFTKDNGSKRMTVPGVSVHRHQERHFSHKNKLYLST